jgi:hypothetical protein
MLKVLEEHPGEVGRREARGTFEDNVEELVPDHPAIVGWKVHQAGSGRRSGTEVREQGVEFFIPQDREVEGQGILVEGEPPNQGGSIAAEKPFGRKAARVRGDT